MLSFPNRSIRALEDLTPGAHNSYPADALISELGRKVETAFSLLSESLSGPRGTGRVVKGDGQSRAKTLGSETGKEAEGQKQGDQRKARWGVKRLP